MSREQYLLEQVAATNRKSMAKRRYVFGSRVFRDIFFSVWHSSRCDGFPSATSAHPSQGLCCYLVLLLLLRRSSPRNLAAPTRLYDIMRFKKAVMPSRPTQDTLQ